MQYINNSILSKHYLDFSSLESTNNNNKKIVSQNLSDTEIKNLYDPKYSLTEFNIYKYVTALDYINESLGCDKYKLTEGIIHDKHKYDNILIDLFYHNVSEKVINDYPIGIVFNIKKVGRDIQDLTKTDINKYKNSRSVDMNFYGELSSDNYFYQDMQLYRFQFSKYAGNSYTYYVFKQLTKLFLKEVYLYEYKGNIYTYKELIMEYHQDIMNYPDTNSVKSLSALIGSKEIKK